MKFKLNQVDRDNDINVVPTLLDEVTKDTVWCGTFQLVWNDLKREVVKDDVKFNPMLDMVDNLNKELFSEDMLSKEYYYKKYGLKSIRLKEEIEKGIRDKFNQESDVLDDFDWSSDSLNCNNSIDRYFFYTMLYRKFNYINRFDILKRDSFGKEYKKVKYFGINKRTLEKVSEQMKVLYYTSEDDFAVMINTKSGDEVIFHKKPSGENFKEIYENMNEKADSYIGKIRFTDKDSFKAPYLDFSLKKEYEEVENKEFAIDDKIGAYGMIEKALQSIKFSINEKGGEVKSEAAIDMLVESAILPIEKIKKRNFYVDDTFALFIREKGKELPYFAARIDDISKYQ